MYSTAVLFLGFLPYLISAAALKARETVTCQIHFTATSGDTCDSFAASWGLTVAGFQALNPGVGCPTLVSGRDYCVVGSVSVPSTTSTTSSTSKTSSTTLATSSSSSSSLSSALTTTTTAATSAAASTITSTTLTRTTSKTLITSTSTSTTTSMTKIVGTNGIATPLPTQPGMVSNCNKFVLVNPGDTCNIVAFYNGPVSTEEFVVWNGGVGGMACTNLQAGTYACIGITSPVSVTSAPTAVVGANGIATPIPTQTGMVSSCNKFVKVNPGDSCDIVAFFNGPVPTENFVVWNGGVGGMACTSLQAGTYACVGVIAATPTSTVGANGITTPLPIQTGMVSNCKKFVKINPGDTCNIVAFYNGPISTENFVLWNTGVGGMACTSLQAGTYACIGV